ncbi:hypothetical protein C1645_810360 [Glomus cerebriforme]|uniref:Uncharacterized protein n=1 Tax=Glomus cerebriforme TaxID=658196 RepID=A0A397S576_9GLOM|nr:hypothetical protein C1645_810360 [Glomus cerebriforme]
MASTEIENENELVDWIEEAIENNHIRFYEYEKFSNIQEIGSGGEQPSILNLNNQPKEQPSVLKPNNQSEERPSVLKSNNQSEEQPSVLISNIRLEERASELGSFHGELSQLIKKFNEMIANDFNASDLDSLHTELSSLTKKFNELIVTSDVGHVTEQFVSNTSKRSSKSEYSLPEIKPIEVEPTSVKVTEKDLDASVYEITKIYLKFLVLYWIII